MTAHPNRRRNLRFLAGVAALVGIGAAVAFVLYQKGYRFNETASLPIGVWRITNTGELRAGQVVNFCPPNTPELLDARSRGYLDGGRCPGNLERMFKPLVAVPGDRVEVTAQGVVVNGRLVPHSAPLAFDGVGRAMPRPEGTLAVPRGQAWVASDYSPYSFDSRYFGAIAFDSVFGVATPVLLSESP